MGRMCVSLQQPHPLCGSLWNSPIPPPSLSPWASTKLGHIHALAPLILPSGGGIYCCHFTDEENEVQEVKALTQSNSANKQQSQDLNQLPCLTSKHMLVRHEARSFLLETKTIITCEITQSKALLPATSVVASLPWKLKFLYSPAGLCPGPSYHLVSRDDKMGRVGGTGI